MTPSTRSWVERILSEGGGVMSSSRRPFAAGGPYVALLRATLMRYPKAPILYNPAAPTNGIYVGSAEDLRRWTRGWGPAGIETHVEDVREEAMGLLDGEDLT